MHVLNLTNMEPPFYRQQVAALDRLGVTSETVSVPGRWEASDPRGVAEYLRFVPRVLSAVDDRFDLIHANYGLTAPVSLLQHRLPVVVSLWGTDLYGPYGWVSRAAGPRCDAVIVMSDRMADEYGRDCTVIPHGVDLDRFVPIDRATARKTVGWDADGRYVLFPYDPERAEKDYDRAARVVERVAATLGESVDLVVIDGVPQEDFVTYLNAADCLLMTSRYEGSPNVVKEAMAVSLPVVSTDVGDVGERLAGVEPSVVSDRDATLVDGVVGILRSGERSNGRNAVRDLSLERSAERIRSVYERVLAEARSVR